MYESSILKQPYKLLLRKYEQIYSVVGCLDVLIFSNVK